MTDADTRRMFMAEQHELSERIQTRLRHKGDDTTMSANHYASATGRLMATFSILAMDVKHAPDDALRDLTLKACDKAKDIELDLDRAVRCEVSEIKERLAALDAKQP